MDFLFSIFKVAIVFFISILVIAFLFRVFGNWVEKSDGFKCIRYKIYKFFRRLFHPHKRKGVTQ
jgi:uncharacterized protein YggT (Ycf19 family)